MCSMHWIARNISPLTVTGLRKLTGLLPLAVSHQAASASRRANSTPMAAPTPVLVASAADDSSLPSPAAPVPSRYVGLWSRLSIYRRNGESDRRSLVLWFQAANADHVDSRGFAGTTRVNTVNKQAPTKATEAAESAAAAAIVSDFTAAASSASTSGPLTPSSLSEERCWWHPSIASPLPAPNEVDVGAMAFDPDDSNLLREDALDGAYYEEWRRVDSAEVSSIHIVRDAGAQQPPPPARCGVVMWSDEWIALAHAPSVTHDPNAATSAADASSSEFTFGQRQPGSEWTVRTSRDGRLGEVLRLPSLSTLAALRVGDRIELPFGGEDWSQWRVTRGAHDSVV